MILGEDLLCIAVNRQTDESKLESEIADLIFGSKSHISFGLQVF